FEEAWLTGERPDLHAFLEGTDTPFGRVLFHELLKVELAYRAERGEQPTEEEYQALFPDYANLIAAAFAQARDQLCHSEGSTTPPRRPPNSSVVEPAPVAPSESPPVPEHMGRYKVVRRLGGGTYGDVYLADDAVMKRQVAIKVPSARLLATERAKEEFLREA